MIKNQGKTQSMPGGPVLCLRLRNLPRHDVRSMCEQDRRPRARERQADNLVRRSLVRLPGTAIPTCVLGTHVVASGRCGQRGASPYAAVSNMAARRGAAGIDDVGVPLPPAPLAQDGYCLRDRITMTVAATYWSPCCPSCAGPL